MYHYIGLVLFIIYIIYINIYKLNIYKYKQLLSPKELYIQNAGYITKNTYKGDLFFTDFQITKKNRVYLLMLNSMYKISQILNIPFFLSSGTLLGYYREGTFISYDYDIDIGIYEEDYSSDLIPVMQNNNFIHYRTFSHKGMITELSFYFKNNIIGRKAKIDIFIHYKNKDDPTKIYWMSENIHTRRPITYQISRFNIKPTIFLNQTVWVPVDTKKYLEEHYGPKWHIPIKPAWISKQSNGYRYHSSPYSIVR
tara:strand:+ start:2074 stop:2832 length:759 start_codon:yes stop_codon:yes gene_type:complete